MKNVLINLVDTIAETLLEVSDIVAEVSKHQMVMRYWAANGSQLRWEAEAAVGKRIAELHLENILLQCKPLIINSIATNKNSYKEYSIKKDSTYTAYALRVLLNHPDKDYLLITIEELKERGNPDLMEDKWLLALDAAGDGVWDAHTDTNQIYFSSKWHEIFGYDSGEIITIDDWASKLHPDDLVVAERNFKKYTSGEVPVYSCELRYYCKDGSYKWILSRGVVVSKTAEGLPLRFMGIHKDISESKQMEEGHYANLSLLLKLMNSLPSGILVTDEDKMLVFANKAFCTMYGIKEHPRNLIGMDTDASLQKDKLFYKNPDELVSRIRSIIKEKKIVLNDELELLDGRVISRDYIPLTFKENHRGEIWKFTDITQQKNIGKRFREQRLFYEHILKSIPTDIAVLDAEGKILFLNPNSVKNEEFRNAALGKSLTEFSDMMNMPAPITEARINAFRQAITEKRKIEWVEQLAGSSGRINYLLRCFSPIIKTNGELDIMIVYGVNITERTIAEEALKTSMNAFANSFTYSGIGKALIAPGGKWLEVNDVICKITGYSKDELLGMYHKDITYKDDIDVDTRFIRQLIAKEIQSYTVEKRYISKTRQIITISLTVSLLWDTDNSPKYFICDIIDITSQKLLTDEVYRQNAQLEATKNDLIIKINQLEDLSHMIAHNLRGPAGNISMLSERLIIDDNDPAAADEVFTKEEAGAIIHESSIALINSLNTLMELTQIKLNKNIAYDSCDFNSFVNDIIHQLHGTIYEKHANITLALEISTVNYPKIYLESILYNLISNSLKYCNPSIPPEIIISTKSINEKVCLTLKDNGLGINLEKYADKVFKLNQVFHAGFDSKGVGLFLTKSQIESLGGSISVKSKPGEGCEFIIIL